MEILQKTEEYVEINKLTLNTNKTEVIFFSRNNSDFGSIFYKNEVFTTEKNCRYLGIQIDRNLTFDEQLNKNGSCYGINLLNKTSNSPERANSSSKTTCAFTLSFSAVFFQNLSAKKTKRP